MGMVLRPPGTSASPRRGAIQQPERWRRARVLFEEILQRGLEHAPRPQRHAFLVSAAGENRELLADVEALLEAHAQSTGLDQPIFRILANDSAAPTPPQQLGPYQLIRELGQGGMGTVYLARRVDGEVEQEVAIKVLRADAVTPQLDQRLRRERQILARLRHPHLARLLDAGTTPDGLPYFVMEPVSGISLDGWIAARQPSLEERLRLFEKICGAVQHAHLHGIVHRDLKPTNVLVDGDNQPHVVDFGVAAILAPDAHPADEALPETPPLTETAGVPITLRYASPEQVSASEVGPSADVFSLGIVLFELLTGHSPYGDRPAPLKVMEALLHGELPSPSSLLPKTSPSVAQRLLGDLDAIVARCLARQPSQRYADAGELADDIGAVLEGRPVAARRGHLYRLGHSLRHRARPLITGVALLLCLLLFAWQQGRLGEHRREMGLTASDAADALADLGHDLAVAGRETEARRLLEEAVDLRSHLVIGRGPSRPVAARIPRTSGGITSDPTDQTLTQASDLANDLGTLGDLQLRQGRYSEAAESQRRSLRILDDSGLSRHPRRALSRTALGLAEAGRGDFTAGEKNLLQGLHLSNALFEDAPRARTRALHDYADFLAQRGAVDAASRVFSQALELARDLFAETDLEMMTLRYDAATAAASSGRFATAQGLIESAAQGLVSLPNDHPLRLFDLERRAFLAFVDRRYDQAESDARQSLEGALRRFGPAHPSVLAARRTLCQVLRDSRQDRAADDECTAAVGVARQLHGPRHPQVGDTLVMHAEAIEPLDRPRAMGLLLEALDIFRSSVGEEHPMVARIYHYRSLERSVAGDLETAERFHRRAITLYRTTVGDCHPNLAYAFQQYAGQLSRRGQEEAASTAYRQAIDTMERGLGPEHPRLGWLYAQLAVHLVSHTPTTDLDMASAPRAEAEAAARRSLELAMDPTRSDGAPLATAVLIESANQRGDRAASLLLEGQLRAAKADLSASSRQRLARLYARWKQLDRSQFWGVADSQGSTSEPGTSEPGTSEPGTSEPGTSEPGTSEETFSSTTTPNQRAEASNP